jgi:hypothetical protein
MNKEELDKLKAAKIDLGQEAEKLLNNKAFTKACNDLQESVYRTLKSLDISSATQEEINENLRILKVLDTVKAKVNGYYSIYKDSQ